jgi:hypothetical protein
MRAVIDTCVAIKWVLPETDIVHPTVPVESTIRAGIHVADTGRIG